MAIKRYLAMTAAEIGSSASLPPSIAWMACHFSPYGTGLSGCPKALPPKSVLMLDDITPIHGHDPEQIAAQLKDCVDAFACAGVLLDFQRPGNEETEHLVQVLASSLPCPAAVSELYARDVDCPVFLPPAPLHEPLKAYLTPWQGREVWLEMALDGEVITLTESGSRFSSLPPGEAFEGGHREEALHCHYKVALEEKAARFTLWRTREDLDTLLEEAEGAGVKAAVGLYQELG